jgi:NAD dependent epimerase/dehydratase family enzyme
MSWVHLEDTVRAIAFALDNASFSGPFNVTAPKPVTMNDFARALGIALGRPSRMRVPAFALRGALGERASVLLTGQRALPKTLEAAGFRFAFPGLEAALADIMTRA